MTESASTSSTATESKPNYAPGTPIWIDLGTPDLAATTSFYSGLFGWEATDTGEQFGHYTMFRQNGQTVAAASPLMSPQQPTVWSTYISSTNVDAMRSSPSAEVRRFLGAHKDFGRPMGLAPDWTHRIIKQVGNYGEIFDRDLGLKSPLKLERRLNNLATKGGLHYAPSFR